MTAERNKTEVTMIPRKIIKSISLFDLEKIYKVLKKGSLFMRLGSDTTVMNCPIDAMPNTSEKEVTIMINCKNIRPSLSFLFIKRSVSIRVFKIQQYLP